MATATKTKKGSREDIYLNKVVAGRYRLEQRLGEGGMGVVYRGRHILIDRVVAIKLIRPDLRSETHLRAWMLREARAANRVDHAHIVDIHDVGETENGELYLVMEYLMGSSLSSEIAKGQMPIARAVDILEQMCAALTRAHDLGVIHRDLKSDNIMMTNRGGRHDFIKILDFGLAALTQDPRLAPKGAVFGTPEYMSPEQARGEDATAQSDLYSLGILFYEMLTGRLPFRSSDRETLLEMQRTGPAKDPREYRKDIPDNALALMNQLLEKDPKNRFQDGHHLHEELKALQRSLPSTVWDTDQKDAPAAPAPPPPPASPGVVEWSRRAANFLRLTSRAYPNGKLPDDVQKASNRIWEVTARASTLEGELFSHQKKLQTIEKRGRALRAEIGRKVEELAQEASRALRDARGERERAIGMENRRAMAEKNWQEAVALADELESKGDMNAARARRVFEDCGAARARTDALDNVKQDYERRATTKEKYAANLQKQIEDLRAQLKRYSEALEADLAAYRDRIAKRVKEALSYEKVFNDCSVLLVSHLRERPECRELLKEIVTDPQRDPVSISNSALS